MHTPFDPRVWPMPSKPHLLIVDDHSKRQDNLQQQISLLWQIDTVNSVPDALRILRSQYFDLILADIGLLEIDGNSFGLLHHIRDDAVLRHLGVILITDQAHETVIEALMAGADDYITVPFSPGDLVMRLTARLALTQRQLAARELHTQAEKRIRLLQKLATDLSSRLTSQDMGKSILQACREAVGTTMVSLFLLNHEEQVLERFFTESFSQEVRIRYQHIPMEMQAPLTEAVRTSQIVWGGSQANYIERYPHLREDIVKNDIHAFIALPLVVEQNAIGVIAISFSQTKFLSPQEHDLLGAVAHLCAQGLERARLYETEKEAREIAEKANQVKLRFLAMISHELRTPLASIKGFASTLLATDVTFTPEEYQDFLGVIDQETDKLTDLVIQLLDLTRLQAGTMRLELGLHTLHDVLQGVQARLMPLTTHHRLVLDLPDNLSPVLVDPQCLSQVIVNLVGNAAKFSPQGTLITLRAFQEHDTIQIDVSDEGMGIPRENRAEVFEVFQQVEKSAEHDPGAGLGLAICKGIIEAHSGRIWVQDREPGTTISFSLRLVR